MEDEDEYLGAWKPFTRNSRYFCNWINYAPALENIGGRKMSSNKNDNDSPLKENLDAAPVPPSKAGEWKAFLENEFELEVLQDIENVMFELSIDHDTDLNRIDGGEGEAKRRYLCNYYGINYVPGLGIVAILRDPFSRRFFQKTNKLRDIVRGLPFATDPTKEGAVDKNQSKCYLALDILEEIEYFRLDDPTNCRDALSGRNSTSTYTHLISTLGAVHINHFFISCTTEWKAFLENEFDFEVVRRINELRDIIQHLLPGPDEQCFRRQQSLEILKEMKDLHKFQYLHKFQCLIREKEGGE